MDIDPWVEEVRVALALNGGISLAVWMGGCAVELDAARRTHCSRAPGAAPAAVAGATTYGAICDAFRRELVVDVISGSSAGGINGALLAGAMANKRELRPEFLRKQWLRLGDFSQLLHPPSLADPKALMQGKYFADQLELTFKHLLADPPKEDAPETSAPTLVAALDVTTTNTRGRALEFRDAWGGTLSAREYRARFEFRDEADYTVEKLADAARATASFPLAFEPYRVREGARELAQLDPENWLVDGGLLDNMPIRAALALIPGREATRQVRRFLCYLNGDPGVPSTPEDAEDGELSTADVIGVMVDLPRKAPIADHLIALQGLARRSPLGHEAQLALLAVPLDDLQATAKSLLAVYRRRRRLRVLQDLLPDPGNAQRVFDALEDAGLELPWLPSTLSTPAGAWPWGFEAARRVHHLAIDLVRAALPRASPEDRAALLTVRHGIDLRLQELDQARDELAAGARVLLEAMVDGDPAALLAPLRLSTKLAGELLAPGIRATAGDLFSVSVALGAQPSIAVQGEPNPRVPVRLSLFGDAWVEPAATLTDAMLETFLDRVVAVEVVRRSFFDEEPVDDGQEIAFAQLTPGAPSPIFTEHPFSAPFQASADRKLCGTILGHFGGFYRRSWRANDFLWGRLDAAARIVEMLVSTVRADTLSDTDDERPWEWLAKQLSHDAATSPQQRALLVEALGDLTPAVDVPPGAIDLETQLLAVLSNDLQAGDGSTTRVLCTRAAQLQILCEELQHVVSEYAEDLKAGCGPSTLDLDGLKLDRPQDVWAAIRRLRAAQQTLPKALGRGSRQELVSDLAVRTIAHAGLVTLGVARQAGGRVASPVTALRSLLLPLSGAVSRNVYNRSGVAAAFAAASLYLGARVVATDERANVALEQISTLGLLLAIVALLVVAGTVALPAARAFLGGPRSRLGQAVMGGLLLIVGVLGSLVLGFWPGELSLRHLVFAPGVTPPWHVTAPALALGTGAALGAPKALRRLIEPHVAAAWKGTSSLLLTFVAALLVARWTFRPLLDALASDELWQQATACLAIAAVPAAAVIVVVMAAQPAKT